MEKGDNEGFEDVGQELRQRIGGEFRLAAEEDEYWAMKQSRRAGTLSVVAYDAMSRGDRVEVWAGESVFRGSVQHTRNDLLTLQAQATVDVNLAAPIILRVVEAAATSGAGTLPNGPASFAARMAELEQSDTVCEFITSFSRVAVVGHVSIRASDHVIVEGADKQEWVVPLKWLMAVVSR